MPGMGAPPPPGQGAGGTGGAAMPGHMPGNGMQGIEKVMMGLKALQDALPSVPLGSELHQELLTAVSKIGKHLPQGGAGGDPQSMIQQLAMMAQKAKAEPQQAAALQGLMGGGGGGAPPPPPGGMPPPQMGA